MVDVHRILPRTSPRYPWDYRVGFNSVPVSLYDQIVEWIEQRELPGVWGASKAFYTKEEHALLIALRWS